MTIAPSHKNDSVVIVTDVVTEEVDVISSDKNDEIDKSELNDSLETKNYNGKDIPVISSGSFNNAFMQAVIQLGASSDQFFCWNNNIYTTEKE
jgi:translation elongation factor EF-Tu-like GTPase